MKKNLTLLLVAALSLFTSCEKEPVLSVSVKEISSPFSGNETSVVITANNPWVAQGSEWCEVAPAAGEAGETSVIIKVKPNETYDPRECDVVVSSSVLSELIKVKQKTQSVIQVENTEYSLSGKMQVLTLPIKSNIDVEVSTLAEWIQFKEIKGLESSNLIFNVQANQSELSRETEIVIKDKGSDVSTRVKVWQSVLNAYLPEGEFFNEKVDSFMTAKGGITKIKFITGSEATSEDALVEKCIYLVKNNETLEIHTEADVFMANNNCHKMFNACDDYDEEGYPIYNSFGKIESIEFGTFNTDKVENMGWFFNDCVNLTSLDLSVFNTKNVTSMDEMFYGCKNLKTLDISSFNTVKVISMSNMFRNCESLASLDLSSFNVENLTSMFCMFESCRSLTSLDLSNFITINVENMLGVFRFCSSLITLDISAFKIENATDLRCMFMNCSSIKSIDISSFDFKNNPDINSMFSFTGENSTKKPIPIYVTSAAKQYIVNDGTTDLDKAYAKLIVKGEEEIEDDGGDGGNDFGSGDLGENEGGEW